MKSLYILLLVTSINGRQYIVTFLMTIYKFVFLHNFLGEFFFYNCCSSVRMSQLCTFDVSLIGMSKTTLKHIANIKEFFNLLSINHQILFTLHLFLISYILPGRFAPITCSPRVDSPHLIAII